MEKRELTELQSKFLDAYFTDAKGNARVAMEMAGYSENTSVRSILESLSEEIADGTRKSLAYLSPESVFTLADILNGEITLGAKERLAAAKDILDRAGFGKTDKFEVKSATPLFVLPAKRAEPDEDDD